MLSCTYEVVAIDGDYAHLRRNDIEPEDNEMKLVARALLPPAKRYILHLLTSANKSRNKKT